MYLYYSFPDNVTNHKRVILFPFPDRVTISEKHCHTPGMTWHVLHENERIQKTPPNKRKESFFEVHSLSVY